MATKPPTSITLLWTTDQTSDSWCWMDVQDRSGPAGCRIWSWKKGVHAICWMCNWGFGMYKCGFARRCLCLRLTLLNIGIAFEQFELYAFVHWLVSEFQEERMNNLQWFCLNSQSEQSVWTVSLNMIRNSNGFSHVQSEVVRVYPILWTFGHQKIRLDILSGQSTGKNNRNN